MTTTTTTTRGLIECCDIAQTSTITQALTAAATSKPSSSLQGSNKKHKTHKKNCWKRQTEAMLFEDVNEEGKPVVLL